MTEGTKDLIAEARVHVPYAGSQDDNWCIHCADDWPCVTRRLADALEAATDEASRQAARADANMREWDTASERADKAEADRDAALAAIEPVRAILDRDDFGDDWEHDEWVYREAAEKKLGEIEAALDGAPDNESLPNHCQSCGAWGTVKVHLRGCSLDGAPEPEWEWEYCYRSKQTGNRWGSGSLMDAQLGAKALDSVIERRVKAGPWLPVERERSHE